jgi:hypothetical protein
MANFYAIFKSFTTSNLDTISSSNLKTIAYPFDIAATNQCSVFRTFLILFRRNVRAN